MISVFESPRGRGTTAVAMLVGLLAAAPAHAQRTAENAVAEADDAFGTVVGNEVIGLYTSTSARGFNPSQAGNLRIDGLYFDQAAAPVTRLVRGSAVHVGISAQGYPFPAPTGVVDFALRAPGENAVASAVATHGAVGSYFRLTAELDAQMPVIANVLSLGGGVALTRNNAHEVAVRDKGHNAALIAHWRPSEALTVTPFWSTLKTQAVGGDRPRIFIGDNAPPRFRADDMTSPEWLFFGFRQYNYGAVATWELPDQWALKAGLFRSENNTPRSFTAFLLNTDSLGFGDYAVEQTPPRFTRSTSGEARLSKTAVEGERRHTGFLMMRGRDRDITFGGGQLRRFGTARLGAFPALAEPQYQTTTPTATETRQATGGLGYEGLWRGVGQLSVALQKTDYERTLTRPGATPTTGADSPWLYNVGAAAYVTARLAVYGGYTRGLEELGTAPGNAINRDEAVPAQRTRQVDAGVRYQVRPKLQLVMGAFMIDKPYFGLDTANVFRALGDIRHRGVEVSLAGPLTDSLTVVAGIAALRPRITASTGAGGTSRLTAVGPIPRLVRVNLQYRPPGLAGLLLDTKIESVSSRYLTASNSRRISGTATWDAGVRYTTTLAQVPVRFRLQGFNLTNTFSVTPQASGQIAPYEARRVEFSLAADF
jgi:iron complex outermembrane receptor protein